MNAFASLPLKLRGLAAAAAFACAGVTPQAHAAVVSSANNPFSLDGLSVMGLQTGNSWTLTTTTIPGMVMPPMPGMPGMPGMVIPPRTVTNWSGSSFLGSSSTSSFITWLSADPVATGTSVDAALFSNPNTLTNRVAFTDRNRYTTPADLTYAIRFQTTYPLPFATAYDGTRVTGQPFTYFGWVTINLDSSRIGQPGNELLQVKSWGFDDAGRSIAAGALSTPASVTPVPEPSTYAMALAGLGVAAWVARRRRVQA